MNRSFRVLSQLHRYLLQLNTLIPAQSVLFDYPICYKKTSHGYSKKIHCGSMGTTFLVPPRCASANFINIGAFAVWTILDEMHSLTL